MKKKEKEFERNVCFTFFEDYRLTAKELEEDFDKDIVADYYNAIIDYALYGVEPEPKGAIKYIWHTTKTTIDKSIERRANGFGREDKEKTEKVLKYKAEHPEATQKEISEKTGVSVGKVNKVFKDLKDNSSNTDSNTNTNSNSNSSSNTTNEREREHVSHSFDVDDKHPIENANAPDVAEQQERKRILKDLSSEELKELSNDYRSEIKYTALYEKYHLCKGELNKELLNTIESILQKRDKEEKYSSIKKKLNEDVKAKEELMKIMSVNEEELVEYLSAIEDDYELYDLLMFFVNHETFTYKEWVKNYRWKEDYRDMTYFEWFVKGINANLLNSQWGY